MPRCEKKSVTFVEMKEIINKYWISSKDLNVLLPQLTPDACRKEFKKVKDEMSLNNELYFHTRPVLLPVKKFINKFHIDTKLIRNEANKIEGK